VAEDAIWRLFEAGRIDEDDATILLLTIAAGVLRMQAAAERRDGGPAG
jgi:hypothetical protein